MTRWPAIYEQLLAYEVDGSRPRDGRRIIRDERLALHVACDHGDPETIRRQAAEARRVLAM